MPTPDGPLGLERRLELLRHDVEGLVPGHRRELAVLGVGAVAHPQQRRGQPVGAVHDLGEEVALDAVEAAIDLGLDVAVGGDDPAVLDRRPSRRSRCRRSGRAPCTSSAGPRRRASPTLAAWAGRAMPATAAAAAAAWALMISRRVSSMAQPPSSCASGSIWWKTSTADEHAGEIADAAPDARRCSPELRSPA